MNTSPDAHPVMSLVCKTHCWRSLSSGVWYARYHCCWFRSTLARARMSEVAHGVAHNGEGFKQQGRPASRPCDVDIRSSLEKLANTSRDVLVGKDVAPGFKNKIRYTPYVSPGSQMSHIATNKGNIERQCSICNILSIKDVTLDSKHRKDTPSFGWRL